MANVLCVVAHPDDEVLGCGGTLAKHAEAGDEVVFLFGTSDRWEECAKATEILGGLWGQNLNLPDQKFDTEAFSYITGCVERLGLEYNPDIVYTHNPDDLNLDHQLVARAVLTAFRPCHSQAAILAFETLSSTEWGVEPFQPNHWEVLSEAHIEKKIDALGCYATELRGAPHPRNQAGVETNAWWRGMQCGNTYAEAFRVLRSIG